jgi:LPPG:FO 2-phospho-L-lactate transferase
VSKPISQRIVILSGGVGGAKLVEGFAAVCRPEELTIIGNTGDDVERHGLWVSPDLDIVTYTLAGLVDRRRGWGFAGESFRTLSALGRLGDETWMNLGDLDLATHIFRTRLRKEGVRPTGIAVRIARRLGVKARVIPPTDDPLQTRIRTTKGWLNFQEFYLRERCKPRVLEVAYAGARRARATPEVLTALARARWVVIAPSNPVASIGPILAVPGIRRALRSTRAMRVAVCPIVGGRSLKGPSDRMMKALGFSTDPAGVAAYYRGLVDLLVVDKADRAFARQAGRAPAVLAARTVMKNLRDKRRLAMDILRAAGQPRPAA